MYELSIIISCLKLYKHLGDINIRGKDRKDLITKSFNVHINSLYNWLKKYKNDFLNYKKSYKYNNVKITNEIKKFILLSNNSNNNYNIKTIINDIFNKFKVKLSKKSIYYVLHKNNLSYKKLTVKNYPYDEEHLNTLKADLKNKFTNITNDNLISIDDTYGAFNK